MGDDEKNETVVPGRESLGSVVVTYRLEGSPFGSMGMVVHPNMHRWGVALLSQRPEQRSRGKRRACAGETR
jgi:hypothetical protein